jgi:hypothetical protein
MATNKSMKILFLTVIMLMLVNSAQAQTVAPRLPNRSTDWLDKKTHSWDEFKGKVVLINVWTFG